MTEPNEARQIRCPRLGHEIAFSYCEREGGDLPCPRIVRCWQSFLPVEAYLKRTLSPDAWERFARPAGGVGEVRRSPQGLWAAGWGVAKMGFSLRGALVGGL